MLFKNSNLMQPETSAAMGSTDQVRVPVSLRCPHCNQNGTFSSVLAHGFYFHKATQPNGQTQLLGALRACPNSDCRGLVLTIQQGSKLVKSLPSETLDFTPDSIPPKIVETLSESVRAHAAGCYRASALMVRRLLEELCDHFECVGPNLHVRLQAIKSKLPISDALFDGAMELKILGNDAAHIAARDYQTIGKEEAELSIEVAKEILKALFQHRSLVERLQKLKAQPA